MSDPDRRLVSGLTLKEACARASGWWDGTGRHLFRNADWGNPDLGLASGITRGLPFAELAREEAAAVIEHWHEHHVLALIPREFGGSA
jgi:hypothetical protein